MLLDLHCHSKYSKDAVTSPKHIAEIAKQKGIVVALTDHNNALSHKAYADACKQLKIPFVLGQEQKVYWGNKFAGELLFYFLNEEIKSRGVLEAIDEARSQGALVSVAHPFDPFRGLLNGKFKNIEKISGKVDAVEAFNSRCFTRAPNNAAKKFALKHSLGMTAGSDAHFPSEIGNALVEVPAASLEEARALIAAGKVKIHGKVSGPLVHLATWLARSGLLKKESD